MKISTNLTEIKELFAHHLGINVSELELTIESEDVPATSNDDGWVANKRTSQFHPPELDFEDFIEVVYSDGDAEKGSPCSWVDRWNTNNPIHIVKYRKVN